MSKTLLAESIAELKQLKQFAIENAKLSFEETITPQIKAILESALAEETEEEVEKEEMHEAEKEGQVKVKGKSVKSWKQNGDKSYDLVYEDGTEDRIAVSHDDWDTLNNAELAKSMKESKDEEAAEEVEETFDIDAALAEIEGTVAEGDDNDEDDDAPAEDEAMKEADEAPEVEVEGGEEDELDEDYINKLLAEVEDEEMDLEEGAEEAPEEDEEMDIKEVEGADKKDQLGLIGLAAEQLKKLFPGLDVEKAKKFEKDLRAALDNATGLHEKEEEEVEEAPEEEKEEATEQAALLESLREMNLLNAKLLYQNKLLLQENFSDEQKANIIKALDKAATANEAKIVFETYKGMSATKKAPQTKVTEKLGFKRIGVLQEQYQPKTSYDPTDPVVAELQRRAGIKK